MVRSICIDHDGVDNAVNTDAAGHYQNGLDRIFFVKIDAFCTLTARHGQAVFTMVNGDYASCVH